MYKAIVKIYFTFIISLAFVAGCNSQEEQTFHSFDDHFEYVESITPDSITYYAPRHLDVRDDGAFLITNQRRTDVFLYNQSGNLIRDLSEEAKESHPGINWSPDKAFFDKEGEVFVYNNIPWGIRFTRDGIYKETTPEELTISRHVDVDHEGNFYSIFSHPNNKTEIKKLSPDGEEFASFGEFPDRFRNVMQRFNVGNHLVVSDDYIFYKTIASPKIYKHRPDGSFVGSFEEEPAFYSRPTSDIRSLREVSAGEVGQDVQHFAENYTYTESIHILSDDLLLVQYQRAGDDGILGVQVLTKEGEFLPGSGVVISPRKVLAARNGKIYTIDTDDEDGIVTAIDVYRFEYE